RRTTAEHRHRGANGFRYASSVAIEPMAHCNVAIPCRAMTEAVPARFPSLPADAGPASPGGVDDELDTLEGLERLPARWVFAYGSLIWHPDFEFAERHLVRVHGYHRAFCISSTRYRGTPEAPGVVLGLD